MERMATQYVCQYCGTLIENSRSKIKCKSRECHNAHQRALQRQYRAEYAERGESYRGRWRRQRYTGRRAKYPAAYARWDATRRARKEGAETFPPREIFERDGWRCRLCGKRVDAAQCFPHPMSASIDHIVPLSDGGEHTRANVQLAHLRCNVRKNRFGGGEQLAMI